MLLVWSLSLLALGLVVWTSIQLENLKSLYWSENPLLHMQESSEEADR